MHNSAFSKLAVQGRLQGAMATLLAAFSLIRDKMLHTGKMMGVSLLDEMLFSDENEGLDLV